MYHMTHINSCTKMSCIVNAYRTCSWIVQYIHAYYINHNISRIVAYQTIDKHMGLKWIFSVLLKVFLGIESNELFNLFLTQNCWATWLSPMQIHAHEFFFFLVSFPSKFGLHILHLTFRFFFSSLHGHEENINDEMILQDDEDNSNTWLGLWR